MVSLLSIHELFISKRRASKRMVFILLFFRGRDEHHVIRLTRIREAVATKPDGTVVVA
jgi:hypothetical protein